MPRQLTIWDMLEFFSSPGNNPILSVADPGGAPGIMIIYHEVNEGGFDMKGFSYDMYCVVITEMYVWISTQK